MIKNDCLQETSFTKKCSCEGDTAAAPDEKITDPVITTNNFKKEELNSASVYGPNKEHGHGLGGSFQVRSTVIFLNFSTHYNSAIYKKTNVSTLSTFRLRKFLPGTDIWWLSNKNKAKTKQTNFLRAPTLGALH